MKRCINKSMLYATIEFSTALLIATFIAFLVLGELNLIISDGSFPIWATDITVLFNYIGLGYGIYKLPTILNYMFPKC